MDDMNKRKKTEITIYMIFLMKDAFEKISNNGVDIEEKHRPNICSDITSSKTYIWRLSWISFELRGLIRTTTLIASEPFFLLPIIDLISTYIVQQTTTAELGREYTMFKSMKLQFLVAILKLKNRSTIFLKNVSLVSCMTMHYIYNN